MRLGRAVDPLKQTPVPFPSPHPNCPTPTPPLRELRARLLSVLGNVKAAASPSGVSSVGVLLCTLAESDLKHRTGDTGAHAMEPGGFGEGHRDSSVWGCEEGPPQGSLPRGSSTPPARGPSSPGGVGGCWLIQPEVDPCPLLPAWQKHPQDWP